MLSKHCNLINLPAIARWSSQVDGREPLEWERLNVTALEDDIKAEFQKSGFNFEKEEEILKKCDLHSSLHCPLSFFRTCWFEVWSRLKLGG